MVARLPPVRHGAGVARGRAARRPIALRPGARRADRRLVPRRDRVRRRAGSFDGVRGGRRRSAIDTAKAANLYTTYPPADFLDYVNAPIGKGLPVPGPLKPLIAIPTTAGTGSETTGVSIFDLTALHAKTGIASRRLKPTLGLLDPDNTRTHAAGGRGVERARRPEPRRRVVHGAAVTRSRPRPERPALRPAYQGSNPISDVWSLQALRMVAAYLVRAVEDPATTRRGRRCCWRRRTPASASATPGVHLPHGMSYPVSGHVQRLPRARLRRRPPAGAARHVGDPERAGGLPLHGAGQSRRGTCEAAEALGADVARVPRGRRRRRSSPTASPGSCSGCRCRTGCGRSATRAADIPALVEGTLPQHRVTKLSPRPAWPTTWPRSSSTRWPRGDSGRTADLKVCPAYRPPAVVGQLCRAAATVPGTRNPSR